MKIQLLNSSKLKISFNKIDLDENNISLHSFLSRSQISQKFIKAIIDIAFEDLGFKIENNNFIYEIYCFDFSEFIIIVYKDKNININSNFPYSIQYNNKNSYLRENYVTKNLSFKFFHNKLLETKNLFFFFNNFEEFLTFSEYIKNSINFKNINSILYEYRNIFLLEITTSNLLPSELIIFQSVLLESKTHYCLPRLSLIKFKEFAKILYSENALNL